MVKDKIVAAIEKQLALRQKTIRNRNAIQALFGAFSDPGGSLGKIILGGDDAMDAERHRLLQDAILDLLCKIDEAISNFTRVVADQGIELNGLIETTAKNADIIIGVDIAHDAGPVKLQPGTHIRTMVSGVRNATGLRIGGEKE